MTQVAAADQSFPSTQAAQRGPVILLYHRVACPPMDPQLLCVCPDRFAEQLRALKEHGRIITMHELVTAIRDNTPIPSNAFVITFDDGYGDNLHQALPLLEAADAAATVFVATGDLDIEVGYWWDQLERIALATKPLPTSLKLNIDRHSYVWTAGPAHLIDREDMLDDSSWNVLSTDEPTSRQKLYRELFDLLRPLSPADRQSFMEQLCQWSGVNGVARESHRRMTKEEVSTLARSELIEVGAHTVNHPVLGALSVDEQSAEIRESKRTIEDIIGREVSSFSYPFGAKRDYLDSTVQAVRHAGFSSACSNFTGVVDSSTALFELPRVLVRDWTGQKLIKRVDEVRCARRACG